jgi:hypothetical protein
MNRQKLLLVILLGVLAISLVYAFWRTPRQKQVVTSGEKRPVRQSISAKSKEEPAVDQTRVHIEFLNRENQSFPGAEKDIFGPLYVEKLPPPPPPPVAQAPPPPPPVVQAPPKQLVRFDFLGFLQMGGEKTVFLSSGNEIFVVKKGSRFGRNKEFQAVDLTPEKLVIRQDDDPQPITVRLAENEPLIPTVIKSPGRNAPRRPEIRGRLLPATPGANPPEQPGNSSFDTNTRESGPTPESPQPDRTKPPAEGITQ